MTVPQLWLSNGCNCLQWKKVVWCLLPSISVSLLTCRCNTWCKNHVLVQSYAAMQGRHHRGSRGGHGRPTFWFPFQKTPSNIFKPRCICTMGSSIHCHGQHCASYWCDSLGFNYLKGKTWHSRIPHLPLDNMASATPLQKSWCRPCSNVKMLFMQWASLQCRWQQLL